jgi:hypothetical protein
VTIENEWKYYKEFRKLRNDYHSVIWNKHWANEIPTEDWGIVFIDCHPGPMRGKFALQFANNADFVILHDTEPKAEKGYGYPEVYGAFKFRRDYTSATPHTTVLSNFTDVL